MWEALHIYLDDDGSGRSLGFLPYLAMIAARCGIGRKGIVESLHIDAGHMCNKAGGAWIIVRRIGEHQHRLLIELRCNLFSDLRHIVVIDTSDVKVPRWFVSRLVPIIRP